VRRLFLPRRTGCARLALCRQAPRNPTGAMHGAEGGSCTHTILRSHGSQPCASAIPPRRHWLRSARRSVRRTRPRTVGSCGPPLPYGQVSRQSRRWHPAHYADSSALVLIEGVEPSRPRDHRLLRTARLPNYAISALVAARGVAPLSAACRAAVLLLDDAASSVLPGSPVCSPAGGYSASAGPDVACIGGRWRPTMVDLAGLEPATFSVRGGCAPCCATSPCCTAPDRRHRTSGHRQSQPGHCPVRASRVRPPDLSCSRLAEPFRSRRGSHRLIDVARHPYRQRRSAEYTGGGGRTRTDDL